LYNEFNCWEYDAEGLLLALPTTDCADEDPEPFGDELLLFVIFGNGSA